MMNNTEINAKVTEIELLEAQIKELKALADARKAEIKAELDARCEDMIDTGIHRIFYKPVEVNSLDTTKAKKFFVENGNIDEFMKSRVDLRLTIN